MTKKRHREWGRWVAQSSAFAEGGQGRLYLVIDSKGEFSGECVLKELKNPKRIERFNAELQAIASLDEHPNVIPLIDSGIYRNPDKPCFVMPKADGTLEDLIKNNTISIEDRLIIFEQVCEGVAYLHTMSIIHRDLKPQNILMFAGKPKVTDLGLCLVAGATRATPTSEVVGPRFYMAPELEDGRQPNVGCEADVYSLGKVLYHLLSGGKVFSREKHKNKDWRLSRLMGDSRLELFDSVFDKAITVEPSRRYANAGELQKAFRQAFNKFRNHPRTTLLKKFPRLDNALQAPESELRSLTEEEWAELLTHAKEIGGDIPQNVLNAACDALDSMFAQLFTEALLINESRLDSDFLALAAGRILCLPQVNGLFDLWLHTERFSRLAMHALRHQDNNVLNAVAKWSMFTLQHCEEVLTKLAEKFSSLELQARQNFLIASIKASYEQKEHLLLELSHDQNLDNVSLEAVVAGLCACATQATIVRVVELADRKDTDEKFAAAGRGIVLGSSPETSVQLRKHDWCNPVMKVIIDAMQKTMDHKAEDNNRMESDGE